jgi:hypothetical protein
MVALFDYQTATHSTAYATLQMSGHPDAAGQGALDYDNTIN